jgi:DNA-binding transcriptional LysR family regulator
MKIENINDFRVLLHTARTGSLTGAAAALGITPAATSAALKRVETQLGTRLFERSTRAMRLTPAGTLLLDYAKRAFELLAEGEAQVGDAQMKLFGTLRLAAPSGLTRTVLLPWLDEFLDQHPGLQLQLHVGDHPLDLVRDEVDLALRYGKLADSGLVARSLATPRAVLCAAPSYLRKHGTPLQPDDLVSHNCLTFMRAGERHRHWRFARHGQWTEVQVDGDRCADDASLAHEWARAGRGLLLKTGLELANDVASGDLVPLLTEWETEPYPLHVLLPSARFVPARVRAMVDFLSQKFERNVASAKP